jgi:hypothetical protein
MQRTRLTDAVIVRAVHAAEQGGLQLDDGDAVQAAARATPAFDRRVTLRAWLLAQRMGLADELARWQALMPWLLGGAAVLVGLCSVPLLKSMIGEGRHISLLGALAAVLALPSASLLLWCGSLLLGPGHAGGGIARAIGALAMRLPGRDSHSARLWAAGIDALRDAGLGLWALGALNHLFWTIAFAGVLLGLLASFAFWSYTIGWETTILSAEFFQRLVAAIGWLPSQLGVPAMQAGAEGSEAARAWWLIGCTLVYGLLPRVLALALCVGVAWRRWGRVGALEAGDPRFQGLAQRFAAWDGPDTTAARPAPRARAPLAVIGFELPDGADGAALGDLPAGVWHGATAGDAAGRQRLLAQVADTAPRAVLLVCRAAATPDRGTERLLLALVEDAERAAVWLQGEAEHPAWRPWLEASPLARLAVLREAGQAEAWVGEVLHG